MSHGDGSCEEASRDALGEVRALDMTPTHATPAVRIPESRWPEPAGFGLGLILLGLVARSKIRAAFARPVEKPAPR